MSNKKAAMSKQSNKSSTKNGTNKGTNKLDFGNMTGADLSKINAEDPAILKQLNIDPLPDFDNLDPKEALAENKKLFYKTLVYGAIIESHREKLLNRIKECPSES